MAWKRGDVRDNAEPYIGRRPSDEVVHKATVRYLITDLNRNGGKYAPEDLHRISEIIAKG